MSAPPNPNGTLDVRVDPPIRDLSRNPSRVGKYDLTYLVYYGPFSRTTIVIPDEEANAATVQQKIRELVQDLKNKTPQPFQV